MRTPRLSFPTLVTVALLSTLGCKDTTAPKATAIAVVPGLAPTGVAGSSLFALPSIKVVDGSGKGFADVHVAFAVTAGGGIITGDSAVTNADGIATITSWTLGRTAGPNTITATAAGLNGSPLAITVMGVAGSAAIMTATAGNGQTGVVGSALSVVPSVTVTDVYSNPVAGVVVNFAVTAGGGSVPIASTTTGANGVASPGPWTIGTTAGINTLTASALGLNSFTFTATGTAGAAAKLGIATQPSAIVFNNVVLQQQPVIQIQDQYNNVVTSATNAVTASIASGTGTLSGTLTVNAVAGVATFTNLVVSGFSTTGNISFAFTSPNLVGVTSATSVTAPAANLTIDNVYITQSTQTYARGVPLVAGRAGLVRVFVKASDANTFAPSVRVRLYAAGNTTAPVQTYTITSPVTSVPTTIDETSFTSSWNVAVPANLMTAGMSILADVDPTGSLLEPPGDNSFPVSGTPLALDVRTVPVYKITFVPVAQPGVVQGDITDQNVSTMMDFAMRVYPIASYDAIVHAPYNSAVSISGGYDQTWNDLLASIEAMRAAEAPTRSFYGVIHWTCPPGQSCGTGLGYYGINQPTSAIGVDFTRTVEPSTNYRSMTAAHEWGHNFGRYHVNCPTGVPSNPDPSYPYNPMTIGITGYDVVLNQTRLASAGYVDLMSYCTPLWISDYTYKAVLNFRSAVGNGPTVGTAPQHGLLVWGHIGPSGVVLKPSFEVDAPPLMPSQSGPYTVRGTDDAGNDVFNLSFQGQEVDHMPGERGFAFVVPMPANGRKPTMIRLTANGREAVLRAPAPPANAGALFASPFASVKATALATRRAHLEWDATRYPMAMVRDAATGQILSFAPGGKIDLVGSGQALDITLSDGVGSVRQTVTIVPR